MTCGTSKFNFQVENLFFLFLSWSETSWLLDQFLSLFLLQFFFTASSWVSPSRSSSLHSLCINLPLTAGHSTKLCSCLHSVNHSNSVCCEHSLFQPGQLKNTDIKLSEGSWLAAESVLFGLTGHYALLRSHFLWTLIHSQLQHKGCVCFKSCVAQVGW